VIRTRLEAIGMERRDGAWHVRLRDRLSRDISIVRARLVVNAAGPWVDHVASITSSKRNAHNVRLVKGSHIVVPKLFDHDRCYIFQNSDGRIVFAIPYEQSYTLIGTTDLDYDGDPGTAVITDDEKAYLCAAANEYFSKQTSAGDIVWTYSGVRPLFDDGASKAQEATRDYVLRNDGTATEGVLIHVFGGKITTYRRLAEAVLTEIEAVLGRRGARWTENAPLPGGDFPIDGFETEVHALRADFPFLDEPHAHRLVRLYGTDARAMLAGASSVRDLGKCFGADLYEREVRYLVAKEWAVDADDILWRRTKCGLDLSPAQVRALAEFMSSTSRDRVAAE